MIKTPEQILKEKKISGAINADFNWVEFIKPADGIPSLEILRNIKKMADTLSVYKHKVFGGAAITITSGVRSWEHHLAIYAELNAQRAKAKPKLKPLAIPKLSWHLKGLAADFTVKGFTNKQVYEKMDILHFGGVEFPDDQNRIHIDLRPEICRFIGATGRVVAHHYNYFQHNKIFHG